MTITPFIIHNCQVRDITFIMRLNMTFISRLNTSPIKKELEGRRHLILTLHYSHTKTYSKIEKSLFRDYVTISGDHLTY